MRFLAQSTYVHTGCSLKTVDTYLVQFYLLLLDTHLEDTRDGIVGINNKLCCHRIAKINTEHLAGA